MAKKINVAILKFKSDALEAIGRRKYGFFTKSGELLGTIEVMDCGQGANEAFLYGQNKYHISCADWTTKIAQKTKSMRGID